MTCDKNTKWQEVLFLKAITLLLWDPTCVSSDPQQLLHQLFHGRKLPPQCALRTKTWATTSNRCNIPLFQGVSQANWSLWIKKKKKIIQHLFSICVLKFIHDWFCRGTLDMSRRETEESRTEIPINSQGINSTYTLTKTWKESKKAFARVA